MGRWRGSGSFAGERGDAVPQVVVHAKPGIVAELIKQRKDMGDERALFRLNEQAEQPGWLQAKVQRGGPGGDLAGIEGIVAGKCGRDCKGRGDGDEAGELQAAETIVHAGQSLEFINDRRRCQDCIEECREQGVLAEPGEIQDDGGVCDNDHSGNILPRVARS